MVEIINFSLDKGFKILMHNTEVICYYELQYIRMLYVVCPSSIYIFCTGCIDIFMSSQADRNIKKKLAAFMTIRMNE